MAEEKSGHDATKDELSKVSGDLENAKKVSLFPVSLEVISKSLHAVLPVILMSFGVENTINHINTCVFCCLM